MKIDYKEKLEKLKDMFKDEDPSAIETINQWEEQVQRLTQTEQFFQFEATRELYKSLKERAKTHMKYRLQKGRTTEDMSLSDAKQSEIEWVLSLFNPNYEQELATLDSLMDAEITN